MQSIEPHLEDRRLTEHLPGQVRAQSSDGIKPDLVEAKLVNDR